MIERLLAPFRKKLVEDAAMSARRIEVLPLPEFLRPTSHIEGPVLSARHIVKSFGGIKAVQGVGISIADCTLHALVDVGGRRPIATAGIGTNAMRSHFPWVTKTEPEALHK
jgi:hypothetical protein